MRELDKLHKIKDKSQEMGLLLEWLSSQDIVLCKRHEHNKECEDSDGENYCGYKENEYVPTNHTIQEILATYFDIDLKKIEEEKLEILNKLREKQ